MDHVRWGMIGCGSVTEVKSGPGFYKSDRSSLLAVTSRTPARARDYAGRHGIPRAYASPPELLADGEIDAVYIATPPSSHLELALAAADAGKHVYVEKPMAMCFADCEAIAARCAERGVRLYVAYYRRAMERFGQVKRWLDEGRIGQVLNVRATQFQPPAPEELSPATLPWRVRPAISGGGKFLDMGSHQLDIFDAWFGPIEEAHGIAANRGGLYPAEDTVSAVWRHAGGAQGFGAWCYVTAEDRDEIEIVGSEGRIDFAFYSDQPLVLTTRTGREEAAIPNPPHVAQPFIQSIVDELTGVGPCPGDAVAAARITRVADTILAGYRAL